MPLTNDYFLGGWGYVVLALPTANLNFGNLYSPPLEELSLTIVDSINNAIDNTYSVFYAYETGTGLNYYYFYVPDPNNPGQYLDSTTIQSYINIDIIQGPLTKIIINYQRPPQQGVIIKHNLKTLEPAVWMVETLLIQHMVIV